eukprot:scaffold3504_cov240-Pinguiococcus_pyrenoidosus.AAC.9
MRFLFGGRIKREIHKSVWIPAEFRCWERRQDRAAPAARRGLSPRHTPCMRQTAPWRHAVGEVLSDAKIAAQTSQAFQTSAQTSSRFPRPHVTGEGRTCWAAMRDARAPRCRDTPCAYAS